MQAIDYATYDLIRRRAMYPTWLKYKVNKLELALLLQLSGYLRHLNRNIVSKKKFFESVTNNTRERRKMEGYLQGCIRTKLISLYEYKSKPGSLSLGITDLGLNVLRQYDKEVTRLVGLYNAETPGLERSSYKSKHFPKVAA